MEATVVKEEIRGDFVVKEMSDGRILFSPVKKAPGTQYGTYEVIYGEVTKEKLAEAKAKVVDDVCRMIRKIAEERDDFFIVKRTEEDCSTTVAHKFYLPTVNDDRDYMSLS